MIEQPPHPVVAAALRLIPWLGKLMLINREQNYRIIMIWVGLNRHVAGWPIRAINDY